MAFLSFHPVNGGGYPERILMINHLKDKVDNLIRLTEAFEKYEVNIKTIKWSDDPADTKRLKASISPARRIIARRVGLNLHNRAL